MQRATKRFRVFLHAGFVSLLILGASSSATVATAQSPGNFTATGDMTAARNMHTATLLPNGRVLIAGGFPAFPIGPVLPVASAELYDPSTGTFTATGDMTTARAWHAAVLLADGRVLIAGGDSLASAELYDPATGTFTAVGHLTILTAVYSATVLNDGRVLITGRAGTSVPAVAGAELYDPATGTFSPVASWAGECCVLALTLLADGRLLVADSDDSGDTLELYDSSTGTFTAAGVSIGSQYATTLLTNGEVLFAGGNDDGGWYRSAEVYDATTGILTATGSMAVARQFESATLLPDGTVLMAGGGLLTCTENGVCMTSALDSAELYNSATGTFSATGDMAAGRFQQTAVLLNSGQVLIAGGVTGIGSGTAPNFAALSSAEIYTPAVLIPAPTLFSLSGDGTGQGAIWNGLTGQIASPDNPAIAGDVLSMYTTSLFEGGVIPPQVAVGGQLAGVLYFGDAPGYPGFYQVNFRVPSGVAPGPAVPVRLTYLSRPSNAVTIGVQ